MTKLMIKVSVNANRHESGLYDGRYSLERHFSTFLIGYKSGDLADHAKTIISVI